MTKQKLKYLSNTPIENSISKSLAYEEEVKEYAAKNQKEKGILEVCEAANKNVIFYFFFLNVIFLIL